MIPLDGKKANGYIIYTYHFYWLDGKYSRHEFIKMNCKVQRLAGMKSDCCCFFAHESVLWVFTLLFNRIDFQ